MPMTRFSEPLFNLDPTYQCLQETRFEPDYFEAATHSSKKLNITFRDKDGIGAESTNFDESAAVRAII